MNWEQELEKRLEEGTLKEVGFSEADARLTLRYLKNNPQRR